MAWPNNAGYNVGTARFVIVDKDAGGSNDVPVYKQAFGADAADPTRVTTTAGLPVAPQKLAAGPTSTRKSNATASSGGTGNGSALSAGTGVFRITADPDNATVVVVGDSTANAASANVNGEPLLPGQATTVATSDLTGWYLAVRTSNDAIAINKIGA